jgi:alkylation response protein AidB-like acyl-CoA dehydrogenase
MNFDLDDTQEAFRAQVSRFAAAELAPGALDRAHAGAFPFDVARRLAEVDLLGVTIEAERGGQGGTLMDAVLAMEAIALSCPRSADVFQAGNFGPVRTLAAFGSPAQRARFLDPVLAGRMVISLGMSEPDAGSAATSLETEARPDGEGFRLHGTKVWGTHSVEADAFLVYCRFGPGTRNIGSVIVERGAEGFSTSEPQRFMGGETWCQLHFDGCPVRPEDVLLGPGGFKKQMGMFNVERIGNTARSLALGRYAFEAARAHALARRQFDRRLCDFQGIQWMFADMAAKLETARLMLYKVASRADAGAPSAQDTAMAKLVCNQAGWEVSNAAMQVMGALGYSEMSLVEFCVRRTRGWMIAGGSTEMLKNRIAEGVFGERFPQRPERPAAADSDARAAE